MDHAVLTALNRFHHLEAFTAQQLANTAWAVATITHNDLIGQGAYEASRLGAGPLVAALLCKVSDLSAQGGWRALGAGCAKVWPTAPGQPASWV